MPGLDLSSIGQLVGVALELGALEYAHPTPGERALLSRAEYPGRRLTTELRERIMNGEAPLGDALVRLRAAPDRRKTGTTFTPRALVSAMVKWVQARDPVRIVDPGAGSGRFIVAAGRAVPTAQLVAIELDPLCALLLRAHLSATGLARRANVFVCDYPSMQVGRFHGRTAFVGNPPYVRHHSLTAARKQWFVASAKQIGVSASQLAGLHAHFVLATALQAAEGDIGCFVTAAEWLDVNYGSALRTILLEHLGLQSVRLIEPTAKPFPDAATTAVICCFEKGAPASRVAISRVARLRPNAAIERGQAVSREKMRQTTRWTTLTRAERKVPDGLVELGEICRVHRGQVTGQNRVWIVDPEQTELPASVLYPAVTRARELFASGFAITDARPFRRVVDLPSDLDQFSGETKRVIERFLRRARAEGADANYIARHRTPWWSVGLRAAAPILASYMARRPPAFVRNPAGVRHINVVHGLYPRVALSNEDLDELTRYLCTTVSCADGRTYCGGLTKFEPKEMERLLVPAPRAC